MAKNGSRKIGRNESKCKHYSAARIEEKNKARRRKRIEKNLKKAKERGIHEQKVAARFKQYQLGKGLDLAINGERPLLTP